MLPDAIRVVQGRDSRPLRAQASQECQQRQHRQTPKSHDSTEAAKIGPGSLGAPVAHPSVEQVQRRIDGTEAPDFRLELNGR